MGLFKRRSADNTELAALRAEITHMAGRLDAADHENEQLSTQVASLRAELDAERTSQRDLTDRVATLDDKLHPLGDDAPEPPATTYLTGDDLDARLATLIDRIDIVDDRLTAVSTELANQLRELSTEIDQSGGGASDQAALAALRDAQTKLANEQARYEIAFRADLAEIADQIKRR